MFWEWGMAIIAASLLGSGHCVGMCGPFAVLATSGHMSQARGTSKVISLAYYHLGRLATYLILGAMMGGLGSVADGLAIGSGLAPIAARWVGGFMVVMGAALLMKWWRGNSGLVQHSRWTTRWNQWVLQVRKRWRFRSEAGAAFSWGLISTWLPCGWLYVFAIAAAGSGGALWGMMLMTAFWIGTLPLLSLVPIGVWWIAMGWNAKLTGWITSAQPFVQPAAACMIIGFGVLTATSRAEISLAKLKAPASNPTPIAPSERLKEVLDQPLPCCQADEVSFESEESGRDSDE